jgi:gamma-D-glutamyl-L-lysine dipeptidyl-peptidase
MQYGITHLSIVPLRHEPSDPSELVSQVLYGECFKVIEQRKKWSKIRLEFDNYEGWIDNKQYVEISASTYLNLSKENIIVSSDLVEHITIENGQLSLIPLGATLNGISILNHSFDGDFFDKKQPKAKLIETAFMYLNTPYLWGGKTPFGIDCSGFTQMVYKLNGYRIFRDASQQAKQGEALSFIEESEPGDLAFFDNNEGNITHVGIIMKDNYIIHAHGCVRIDRLDHTGIFNTDLNKHTHKLRVIKRIIR